MEKYEGCIANINRDARVNYSGELQWHSFSTRAIKYAILVDKFATAPCEHDVNIPLVPIRYCARPRESNSLVDSIVLKLALIDKTKAIRQLFR